MSKLKKNKNTIKIILMIFLIIQPLLDLYYLYSDVVMDFVGFSPSTVIRVGMIGLLTLLVLMTIKFNKKYLWFILYGGILILYFLLHHINSTLFSNNTTGTFNYNLFEEIFYIIRMVLPFAVAFITFHVNVTNENIRKVIFYIISILTGIIIITNILCISLPSYGTNEQLITSNIFSWFNVSNISSNVDISSRGLFMSANQLSALLTMLLPFVIYFAFYKRSNKYFVLLTLQIITLLMLGTRISSYAWILIMIAMFILYLFFTLMKKEIKINKIVMIKYGVVFLSMIVLFNFSPIQYRLFAEDYAGDAINMTEEEKEEISSYSSEEKIKFVEKNYDIYHLNKEFVEDIYNYENNYDFWIEVMKLDFLDRSDSRLIEGYIMTDLYKNNNNSNDVWFGISFSRLRSGGFYLEHDFLVHFYTLGLLGSLLLVWPYLIIILLGIFRVLKNYKEKFTFNNITCIFSLSLMCMISYFTGSVLDQLFITLIAGFLLAVLYKNLVHK